MRQKSERRRTRQDPLAELWPEIEEMLGIMPELQAVTLFHYLQGKHPDIVGSGQRRTLERRVSQWKALNGAGKEVFFDQKKEPGRSLQLDWMNCNKMGVLICGRPFDHLLCHCILPFSGWEWASVCFSESLLSLQLGLQSALQQLGHRPSVLQIDNCSAATRRIGQGSQKREFTDKFLSMMEHYGLKPRKIQISSPHENGSIESAHGHLRRRLQQALLLRGSLEFASQTDYESFLNEQLVRANLLRQPALKQEIASMPALSASALPDYEVQVHRVGKGSLVNLHKRVYSLPSRLIGLQLRCCIYLERIEFYNKGTLVHKLPRLYCKKQAIQWRDLIESMKQKPGALAGYRYRDAFFPSALYERLYGKLQAQLGEWKGQVEYLQILSLCRDLDDTRLEEIVESLLCEERLSLESFREALGLQRPHLELKAFDADLSGYDSFLEGGVHE